MHHDLKIWPQYFSRVEAGSKTFEVRVNDRGFQKGDTVTLHEWSPELVDVGAPMGEREPKGYTGRKLDFQIGYVLPIDDRRVAFSLIQERGKDCESGMSTEAKNV